MEKIEFDNDDLVKVRIEFEMEGRLGITSRQEIDCWLQVMFIDIDGSFIGRLKKIDKSFFYLEIEMEDSKFKPEDVRQVYKGEKFCYNDYVTTCDCQRLCRNK